MVNASGAAMLAALAPGRVSVAFGTGFNGTRALGAPAATWPYLKRYVLTCRALLRGETVEWDGHPIRMLHPDGHAPARPIDLPMLISALGPKGVAITREIADGLFTVSNQTDHAHEFSWATLGIHGTVLDNHEPLDSPRVQAAVGAGHALAYHTTYEFGGDVTQLPGGQVWLDVITAVPERERHLAVHDQHLVGLNRGSRLGCRKLARDPDHHGHRISGTHRRAIHPLRRRTHHRDHVPALRPGPHRRARTLHHRRPATMSTRRTPKTQTPTSTAWCR